jgi:uncharacterized phage protein (TIGR02216 family)
MSAFDWPVLLQVGLGRLRLTPDRFWALTPVELRLMAGPAKGPPALGRSGLAALMKSFPDLPEQPRKGETDE